MAYLQPSFKLSVLLEVLAITYKKINTALIQFNEHGTPVATNFDDVYFSNDDGAAETQHVFIAGNNLTERFLSYDKSCFVIAETGFGTGLNCALAIAAFERFRVANPEHVLRRLHIVSVEKYPLTLPDLSNALNQQPTSEHFKQALIKQYPLLLAGVHRMDFGDTTIDLHLGEASEMFGDIYHYRHVRVNAWFLDGFAPSKNPDMWTQTLFDNMAKLSAPRATVATFTAAGKVRRGLIAAGFSMQKTTGFGRKREMLVGHYAPQLACSTTAKPSSNSAHIAIIGAGLAGANLALSLAKRGKKITLFDSHDVASGASGNPQGGLYPQLHAKISNASLVQALCFDFAKHRYQELIKNGFAFAHEFCGVLLLAFSEVVKERQEKLKQNAPWPERLVYPVSAEQAATIANIPIEHGGLFIPDGGWISPPELVNALLDYARCLTDITIFKNTPIEHIEATGNGIDLMSNNQRFHFEHVVITAGANTNLLTPFATLPFGKTRGQVESIPASNETQALRTVLCHKGYFTPQIQGRQALGSTYARNDSTTEYRVSDAETNFATHNKALNHAPWLQTIQHDFTGRAATRMTLPDHQPAIGTLIEGNWANKVSLLSGLGSRGLTTAPLMAEILTSDLCNEPIPLTRKLYDSIHFSRFARRNQV